MQKFQSYKFVRKFVIISVFLLAGAFYLYYFSLKPNSTFVPTLFDLRTPTSVQSGKMDAISDDVPPATLIAQELDTPWGIAFLPEGSLLVTERKGTVRWVSANGELCSEQVVTIAQVREIGEGGLLGIDIHPDFESNGLVYLYYTYSDSGRGTLNRVVRMRYKDKRLRDEEVIVDAIPGASNHNGGRIKFGPDGFLYIATGDAQVPSRAQDRDSLAGKILRVTDNGDSAFGNPFNTRIYSFGHRNPQGITWDDNGTLWETEHGRSGVLSGLDEINLIQAGKNYGWPDSQGDDVSAGTEGPIRHSGATNTWAPSGVAYLDGSLYFGGLRGQALYQAVLSGSSVTEVREHFKGQFGRIREVVVGPDKMLYITTSNRDGRGNPDAGDDRIIRVNPAKL